MTSISLQRLTLIALTYFNLVNAWGKTGHQITARIATELLSPEAQIVVTALLPRGNTPYYPSSFEFLLYYHVSVKPFNP